MKKVLITGADSYIGCSFDAWGKKYYSEELQIETVDMIDGSWRKKDFSPFDVVYHVAGLAHADVGNADEATKRKYYAINTDLAVETAEKAKREGVKQFIFMSSAIIYGDSAPFGKEKRITRETIPSPANYYGDSKWQADQKIRAMETDMFTVTILRPPMIYGKGSKGNYPLLAKMAKKMPVFPAVCNERSMLFIENLCEFLCQIIIHGEGGVFFPQNAEYVQTSEMVKTIAKEHDHKILVTKTLNWFVWICARIPGKIGDLCNKAFGNLSYDQSMSSCDFPYIVADFKTSIERTEK